MATKRDYYDILEIQKNASDEDIKKAYRRLAKKYHPDVSKEANAETKFKEVQEAYDVLNDQQKRAQYDQFGHAGAQFNGGQGGFGGFEGFSGGFEGFGGGFEDIFSHIFGGGRRRDPNAPRDGADIQMVITISFMESVLGTKKQVRVEVEEDEKGGQRVRKSKTVDVDIPAGVDSSMTLRVAGYGHGGTKGGAHGDLLLSFNIRPHRGFVRKGNDIIISLPITISQAVLGTKVLIPTIYGDVELTVPAGVKHGQSLKLRGKGVVNVRNKTYTGDQLVVIEIEIPKNLSKEEKKLFTELDKLETKNKESIWSKFKNIFKND